MMDVVKSVREHMSGWTNGGEASWYAYFPKILVATFTSMSHAYPVDNFSSSYTPPARTDKAVMTFTRPITPFLQPRFRRGQSTSILHLPLF